LSSGVDLFHYLEVTVKGKPRIAVVTAGHLSTCPRMLKAADALSEAGYEVECVSTRSTPWATEADRDVYERRGGKWRWTVVDYRKSSAPGTYFTSGARHRLARARARRQSRIPLRVATRAHGRVHVELVRAALGTGADFFYGGTTGGIAAAREAAARAGRPYALDLEDFYSGDCAEGSLDEKLATRIEEAILKGAAFLTAGSAAIADAYRAKYGVDPATIHNTFPLPAPPSLERGEGPLRLYWFSQTIGPGRGLEQAIEAVGLSRVDAELRLRGSAAQGFDDALASLAREKAPRLRLAIEPPGPPDEMTRLASGHDVGLALEQGATLNNRLALGNKPLTYVLTGLALALTDVPGHRNLARDLGDDRLLVPPTDVRALAEGFRRFAGNDGFLARCRSTSWEAAKRRWHWEHPEERGKLLGLVEAATAPRAR
jgi:hypothetical protein